MPLLSDYLGYTPEQFFRATQQALAKNTSSSGGSGSVSSFAFTNSTGITGDVSTSTTTPTLSLTLTAAAVGLGNVTNTSDANKPISTATQTALDLKAPLASPTFTGTVAGITKSMVGLGNVDNTSDANKPISSATQTQLDLKAPLASPALTGTPTAPTASVSTNTTQVATTAFVQASKSWNILASGSVTNQTTATIDFSSYYSLYDEIVVTVYSLIPLTDNVNLNMLLSADGSTFANSSGNYMYSAVYANSTSAGQLSSSSATAIVLANAVDSTSTNANFLNVTFYKPSQSTLKPGCKTEIGYVDNANANTIATGWATRLNAQVLKALRLSFSSGNITAAWVIKGIKYS